MAIALFQPPGIKIPGTAEFPRPQSGGSIGAAASEVVSPKGDNPLHICIGLFRVKIDGLGAGIAFHPLSVYLQFGADAQPLGLCQLGGMGEIPAQSLFRRLIGEQMGELAEKPQKRQHEGVQRHHKNSEYSACSQNGIPRSFNGSRKEGIKKKPWAAKFFRAISIPHFSKIRTPPMRRFPAEPGRGCLARQVCREEARMRRTSAGIRWQGRQSAAGWENTAAVGMRPSGTDGMFLPAGSITQFPNGFPHGIQDEGRGPI